MKSTGNNMNSDNVFRSRVAIVTGGSGGIGRAIALGLAGHGATVCVVGRNRDTLEKTSTEIHKRGGVAHLLRADLTDESEVQDVARLIEGKFGRLDILVHSAGVYRRAQVAKSSLEDFDFLYRVNVRGVFDLTQNLLPLLIASRGQIVFVNSTQGITAGASVSQYAATQHAKKAIADSLREEVNQLGVRVISIYPGRTASNMTRHLYEEEGRAYNPAKLLQPADISDVVTNALALPRSAEVTNIFMRPMEKSY